MKKRIARIAAVLCAGMMTVSLAACSGEPAGGRQTAGEGKGASTNGDEIVVGCVVPLTGSLAAFGHGDQEMRDYAVAQINDKGGIKIDDKDKKIKIVYADSESDATKASEAASKLIESENIDVMITSHTNDTTIPVAAACERAGVPCLSVDTPDDAWANEGPYTYCFHAGFNTENELNCFKDAWDKVENSNKKIGLLYANDVEGQELSGAMKEFAKENGYTLIDPGSYTAGATDYTSIINKLKSEQCDIVCGVMVTPDFATFYSQMKSSGYMPKVCTVAKATLFAADVNAVGANGVGDGVVSEVWWTPSHPYTSSISGQTSKEIGDVWMELTGDDYAPATAGYDYANIEILYDVLSRAGTSDAQAIIKAAAETDLDSVIGPINFNEDHVSIQPLVTGQWCYEDGKWVQNIIANTQVPDVPITADIKFLK
ncbi:Leucine-specific-binding protein precursor [uncultured Roseburia sp.]|uniref:ABC transporter substrate-binding protein n=1 Tax=Brotonthovivens ammoniilytica TaxID=2981725 RepID=A0ABT2TGP0_9FIRM|nr:ABC transporter substrate-binding protein [Brotonthovivens ammoniilytica]MCU6760739.1 ABC transporter substrate-binding protein [Brotonthovivens ammoniilytica]SCI07691.1 Leucine-specific-binding protein precursor [uncultured Roseburia sp.]